MWYAKCVEAVQELRWCYMPASLFWILLRFDESIRMLQSHLAAEDLGLADDKLYIQTAVENCNEQQDTHVYRAHRDGYWTGSSLEPKLLQGRELLARCHDCVCLYFCAVWNHTTSLMGSHYDHR